METYKTFSESGDLTGSMDVMGGIVDRYFSNNLHDGDIDPRHNSVLDFKVTFPRVSRVYRVKSFELPGGIAYVGAAKNDEGILAEEPWAATASTMVMFEEGSDGYAVETVEDTATKAAS